MWSMARKLRNTSPSKSLRKAYAIMDGEPLRGEVDGGVKMSLYNNSSSERWSLAKRLKFQSLPSALVIVTLVN